MSDEVAREVSAEDAIGAKYFPDAPVKPQEVVEDEGSAEVEGQEGLEAEAEQPEGEVSEDEPAWAELQLDDIPVFTSPEHQEKVKEAFLRWQDYTTKTQEIARTRDSLALAQQQVEAQQNASKFAESIAEEQQTIAMLNAQMKRYEELNWHGMTTEEMVRTKHDFEQLERQKRALEGTIQEKQSAFVEEQQKSHQEYLQKSADYLKKEIPGWGDEMANEVAQYALSQGYTDSQLSSPYISPVDVKIIYKAMRYDSLKANTQKAKEKANKAPPVLKPGPTQKMNRDKAQYLNFRKALKNADGTSAKERILQERIASKFG